LFKDKNIVVGVTGGIAVYKAAELVRALVKRSASVRVVMTEAAMRFVAPLTFETLSGHAVLTDLFSAGRGSGAVHIDWARWPHLILVCPATANTVAKAAHGLADNALTTTLLATTAPVLFCPAMNKEMYANRLYQENQNKLIRLGYHIVAPGIGNLACGETGWGRLAELEDILFSIEKILLANNDYAGRKILVTAGPTYEPIDPVRYIGNRSSGKMGYALAERALMRGAEVTLISGPCALIPPKAVRLVPVRTAAEMQQAVQAHLPEQDILIMAAAVSDYRPAVIADHKIKKSVGDAAVKLERTVDILADAAEHKGKRIHIGFSVETENEVGGSLKKMRDKQLDLIVLNNPLEPGAGFEVDTNRVTFLDASGGQETLPLMSKREVADRILDRIQTLIPAKN